MAQYTTGTVNVTQNSNIVTGNPGTKFLANVLPGQGFKVKDDPVVYTISLVTSDTSLQLSAPFQGTTASFVHYQVTRDFTPNYGLAEINVGDQDWPTHLTYGLIRKLDTVLGTLTVGAPDLSQYVRKDASATLGAGIFITLAQDPTSPYHVATKRYLDNKIGVANGIASLDATGKVPASQLPAASGGTTYTHPTGGGGSLTGLTGATVISGITVTPEGHVTGTTTRNLTAANLGLGNVTNESKDTMFTNPVLTGVPTAPTAAENTDTTQIATTAFVDAYFVKKTGAPLSYSTLKVGSGAQAEMLSVTNAISVAGPSQSYGTNTSLGTFDYSGGCTRIISYGGNTSTYGSIEFMQATANLVSSKSSLRIDSAGNFLANIGSTQTGINHFFYASSSNIAMVAKQGDPTGNGFYVYHGANSASKTSLAVYDHVNSTTRFAVYSDGSGANKTGAWGSLSDANLKTNIVDARDYLDDLCQVRVRKFNFIDEPDQTYLGVIAQELETIFPGMVVETTDAVSGAVYKTVKTSIFIPMLIKSVQVLRAKNDALEARIAALEG